MFRFGGQGRHGWLALLKKAPEAGEEVISSPNGRVRFYFTYKEGQLSYRVERDGHEVIGWSRLGLVYAGEPPFDSSLRLVRVERRQMKEEWETVWGEERTIVNHYEMGVFYLAEAHGRERLLTLRVRVFDRGIGLRYEIPAQPQFTKLTILEELTEFNVDLNGQAWQIPAYQPDRYEYNYERVSVGQLNGAVHTPLTIENVRGVTMAIHEAALYDYGAMNLQLNQERRLKAEITPLSTGVKAIVELPFQTPWRVILLEERALDLVTNRIVLNLNEPPRGDFSWVRPLKFLGIWWAMFVGEWTWAPGERHGATTKHALEYLLAAKELNIKGLLVEGWNNGWEGNWLLSGAQSDFLQPMADFDLAKVTMMAKLNQLELIGHHETVGYIDNYEKQMVRAYQKYQELGVHYIKSGYAGSMMTVDGRREYHHSQIGVRHYQRALELAAKYQIMLDVHEPIKGTGIERTWPNLLTREGARGQEYEGGALFPSHACILPFTRLLAGGMDYTSGIFDVDNPVKRLASTLARQLAYYIVIPSGMQMVADRPRFYLEKYSDLFEWMRAVPINFERSVPLAGEIGQYYIIARQGREDRHWWIGGVTNEQGRMVYLDWRLLGLKGLLKIKIYRDSETAHYRDNQLSYVMEEKELLAEEGLEVWMAAGGGFALEVAELRKN